MRHPAAVQTGRQAGKQPQQKLSLRNTQGLLLHTCRLPLARKQQHCDIRRPHTPPSVNQQTQHATQHAAVKQQSDYCVP